MVEVDFIAGHRFLAQAAQSVYEALKGRAVCRWHIGRPIKPTGATAAVFVDHIHHHPDFAGWPQRFYLLHDLGDIDVYTTERHALRQFTAVFVPDETHAARARQYVGHRWWRRGTTVLLGGWPKYDQAHLAVTDRTLREAITALPDRPTILYAVSWAGEDEWKTLLPLLARLPVNLIIKNHPYGTAPGEEVSEYYRRSRQSAAAMAAWARQHHVIVATAGSNVCALFSHIDAVISDQSSVLAEFLPWGTSIETGTNPHGAPAAAISRWYPGVVFWPGLAADVRRGGRRLLNTVAGGHKAGIQQSSAGQQIADMIWQKICT